MPVVELRAAGTRGQELTAPGKMPARRYAAAQPEWISEERRFVQSGHRATLGARAELRRR